MTCFEGEFKHRFDEIGWVGAVFKHFTLSLLEASALSSG